MNLETGICIVGAHNVQAIAVPLRDHLRSHDPFFGRRRLKPGGYEKKPGSPLKGLVRSPFSGLF
jgi:hypothetical protein